jgi:hypothetical protein
MPECRSKNFRLIFQAGTRGEGSAAAILRVISRGNGRQDRLTALSMCGAVGLALTCLARETGGPTETEETRIKNRMLVVVWGRLRVSLIW